jgi:hypothetical protein
MKRADHGQERASHPLEGFPRSVASASARKSFEREMVRLREMSVEARIAEALSLNEDFSWLEPVVVTKDA